MATLIIYRTEMCTAFLEAQSLVVLFNALLRATLSLLVLECPNIL